MMKLFYTQSSPYANCVRMVIAECGIESQVTLIETPPFNNDKDFLKANPLGKVPCLVNNGDVIVDSQVICDYLDANFTGGTLFNPIYADWRLKSLLAMCIGLMDVCVSRRMEQMRNSEQLKSDFWWERFNLAISRTLAEIERQLELFPAQYSILHIYLISSLGYLDFRHQDIDWRKSHQHLAAFYRLHQARESVQNNSFSA